MIYRSPATYEVQELSWRMSCTILVGNFPLADLFFKKQNSGAADGGRLGTDIAGILLYAAAGRYPASSCAAVTSPLPSHREKKANIPVTITGNGSFGYQESVSSISRCFLISICGIISVL